MAEKEMSFLEHLEDLRWHLLRSIVAILIAALAAFLAKNFVFKSSKGKLTFAIAYFA